MEIEEDIGPDHNLFFLTAIDYISFLKCLRQCDDDSFMVETKPHGASSPIRVKYEGFKSPCVMQPNRKRIKPDLSANEVLNGDSEGGSARREMESVRWKRRRKEKKDKGLYRRNIVFRGFNGRLYDCEGLRDRNCVPCGSNGTIDDSDYSKEPLKRELSVEIGGEAKASERDYNGFEEEQENLVGNDESVEETVEIESQQTSFQPEPVNPHNVSERKISVEIGGEGLASGKENNISEEEQKSPGENDVLVEEMAEIEPQQTSPQPEPVKSHLQFFYLLMKKLCPTEMTTYPGYNDGNEGVTKPMAEPNKSKSIEIDWIEEKKEEVESRNKGNKRDCTQNEATVAFSDLSDSDDEPRMDDIPLDIISRPPSDYKDRLLKELKRPFDKCEYRKLINEAARRSKKIVSKELRPKVNGLKAESTPKIRERVVQTEEYSKSLFDFYPEVKNKVRRARHGHGLALLRGFFFWLLNNSWEGSFKPWIKWRKGSKVHQDITN